jgi:radical SAM protein with 4Fe4S-binding SPASM domain
MFEHLINEELEAVGTVSGADMGGISVVAIFYIIRSKRRGEKCIGCPYSKQCSGNCSDKNKSE